MQNKQTRLNEITDAMKTNYHKFLKIIPNGNPIKEQMPHFQLVLFANQASEKNYVVTVKFNNNLNPVTGKIEKLDQEKLLITTKHGNFSRITNFNEIQAICRVY